MLAPRVTKGFDEANYMMKIGLKPTSG